VVKVVKQHSSFEFEDDLSVLLVGFTVTHLLRVYSAPAGVSYAQTLQELIRGAVVKLGRNIEQHLDSNIITLALLDHILDGLIDLTALFLLSQ
jgi:hypothetical protein